MKRFFTFVALAIGVLCAGAQGQYAQGSSIPVGTSSSVSIDGITMTYSNSENVWGTPETTTDWAGTDWATFNYHMQATAEPTYADGDKDKAVPTGGGYLVFEPTKAGTLLVMIELNNDKTFDKIRVTKGTEKQAVTILNKEGQVITSNSQKAVAIVKIDAEANAKYYVFAHDSKIDFYGFAFGYTTITTSASGMCTWSDTQNTVLPSGLKAYTAKVNGTTANLTEVDGTVIPANSGVVLSGTANALYVMKPAGSDATVATLTGNELLNTAAAAATPAASDKVYILVCKDGKSFFGKLKNDGKQTISTHKAYLKIASGESIEQTDAKSLTISFGEATAISNVVAAKAADAAYYSLSGQRISKPAKGLYIHNGKKYVAK